ncbi:MAG: hypothetical protein DWQ47_09065 [Acidobacteria bacterium]|nr:MAG: hypothetical protein DWQ32_17165 [Acidobacteriota bacterium]REJ98946.1 MAG: hypothetical protein DWQ38_12815 [Acidobacteriota bacterium]REK16334.1 MAG: hypothetical protein DWQ43_04875 [Acidobacteriota bacterium]REK44015.1 MAG: hypothetical protein DWQ47_09065 [Acidobacteriota bacterium]
MQEVTRIPKDISREVGARLLLVAGSVGFCAAAAIAIAGFPLQASILTIFLFAGVHNFMEFRYFLAKMPLVWGRSAVYYSVAITGTVFLTVGYLYLYFFGGNWLWSIVSWQTSVSAWNSMFVLWVGILFWLRARQKQRADGMPAMAIAFFAAGLAWFVPAYWSLALVYVHPLIAFWFLERQIRRSRREWLRAYHLFLATITLFIIGLWAALASRPDLSNETALFWRIIQHAGGGILAGVSTHFLVATHVFLETLHYAAWIVLIPLVDRRAIPWRFSSIPLFANKRGYPKMVAFGVAVSALLVVILWAGFSIDYATTRDIYFAFAIAHVLAEFPFLIKLT